jgi:hypothetical protein
MKSIPGIRGPSCKDLMTLAGPGREIAQHGENIIATFLPEPIMDIPAADAAPSPGY